MAIEERPRTLTPSELKIAASSFRRIAEDPSLSGDDTFLFAKFAAEAIVTDEQRKILDKGFSIEQVDIMRRFALLNPDLLKENTERDFFNKFLTDQDAFARLREEDKQRNLDGKIELGIAVTSKEEENGDFAGLMLFVDLAKRNPTLALKESALFTLEFVPLPLMLGVSYGLLLTFNEVNQVVSPYIAETFQPLGLAVEFLLWLTAPLKAAQFTGSRIHKFTTKLRGQHGTSFLNPAG